MILNEQEVLRRIEELSFEEPNSGCILWAGPLSGRGKNGGYARLKVEHARGKKKTIAPLRFLLAKKIGRDLRRDELACHRCDNPPCVNLDHVFIGSTRDNALDAVAKGLAKGGSMPGEANPSRKLSSKDVLEMRRRYADGESSIQLARSFGVSWTSAKAAIAGKTWGHL